MFGGYPPVLFNALVVIYYPFVTSIIACRTVDDCLNIPISVRDIMFKFLERKEGVKA